LAQDDLRRHHTGRDVAGDEWLIGRRTALDKGAVKCQKAAGTAGESGKSGTDMGIKIVGQNKKAYHDYFIDATYEAGMVLSGPEVKSLRAGKVNLRDGYAQIDGHGEVMLYNVHISFYTYATHNPNEPLRVRKVLLHKQEIRKLIGKLKERGLALIPLKIYFNERGRAKIELGLARGKKQYDKRATLKEKESNREVQRAMHQKNS
jgi:SsrA-binding protein